MLTLVPMSITFTRFTLLPYNLSRSNLLRLVNQFSVPNAIEMHLTIYTFGYITNHNYNFTIVLNGKTTAELVKTEQFKTNILNKRSLTVSLDLIFSCIYC